jgi:hypothetical protein
LNNEHAQVPSDKGNDISVLFVGEEELMEEDVVATGSALTFNLVYIYPDASILVFKDMPLKFRNL